MSPGAEKRQVRQAPPSCPLPGKVVPGKPSHSERRVTSTTGSHFPTKPQMPLWKHFWPSSSQKRTDAKTTVLKRPMFIHRSYLQRLHLSTLCIISWNNLRAASHLGEEVSYQQTGSLPVHLWDVNFLIFGKESIRGDRIILITTIATINIVPTCVRCCCQLTEPQNNILQTRKQKHGEVK